MPSKSQWNDKQIQFQFLENLANKFSIKKPSDWGNITTKSFSKHGGSGLLKKFRGSLTSILKNSYPEIKWETSRNGKLQKYWNEKENQIKFFEIISQHLQIKKPSEWGKVTTSEFIKLGGRSILHHYGGSLQKALKSNYPTISWKSEWFQNTKKYSAGYWSEKKNQIIFFKELETKLNIKKPSDWKNISRKQVLAYGGYSALQYHQHSLPNALKNIYSDINWKKEWFPISKHSTKYWNSISNSKKFLDEIADRYNITEYGDWNRISLSLIKMNGGQGLLKKYNSSITLMLSQIYFGGKWNFFQNSVSGPQISVLDTVENIFPSSKQIV